MQFFITTLSVQQPIVSYSSSSPSFIPVIFHIIISIDLANQVEGANLTSGSSTLPLLHLLSLIGQPASLINLRMKNLNLKFIPPDLFSTMPLPSLQVCNEDFVDKLAMYFLLQH